MLQCYEIKICNNRLLKGSMEATFRRRKLKIASEVVKPSSSIKATGEAVS
jgi:hypothetical protein